jgi:hypothetical protein
MNMIKATERGSLDVARFVSCTVQMIFLDLTDIKVITGE